MPWKIGAVSVAIIIAFVMIGGCGSQPQAGGSSSRETDAKAQYNETKQMVLDILHTKEGMDTLKDIVRDPQFKRSLAINETDVQVAMLKALTDGSAHATLEEQMRNPKFASALAKSFKKDNEKVLKDLLKDPEYQQMMLVLLKTPEFTQNLYDLMKTPEYRKQTMSIMTQSLQNPEFKLLYLDLLKQAIREGTTELTPTEKKKAGIESEAGGKAGEKKEGEKKKKEGEGGEGDEGGEGGGSEGGSEKEQGGGGEGGGGGGGS
ncbi:spore germination protein D [Tumebacillus sp. BK434]|uniref:spore germination lipoprotein GerD n=1 Tax=Tumebacillus sp. BK434 TaxID=2512169 RepID=UPI0010DEB958|nr:spore germination lipoprotein GerD [Tumebacillus sp. BK434]TCP52255.1 spore germination protein D [Tumebacillus sp. BK434]